MLPPDAARRADEIEAAAFADLYAAAPPALAARLDLRVEQHAGATALFAPAIPSAMFNRVMGLGWRAPADQAAVDHWIERYRAAGSAPWWLHWNPAASPAGFGERLVAWGFVPPARRRWAKVMRAVSPAPDPPPTALQIGPARAGEARAIAEAVRTAFEMPSFMADWLAALAARAGWTLYAARASDTVVGGACLFVQGDTGWLGMGAVLPSHRRQGGQQALMAHRIADAAAAGCRWAVTETGEPIGDEPNPSLANMHRCGFETVASRLNFEWRGAQRPRQ
ncbi:MAG TPA: GNAT family N-acetyltransferase [Ideonella sp.]|nr:GNAT family N-acetyltransferase [Ideonella sp.]